MTKARCQFAAFSAVGGIATNVRNSPYLVEFDADE